MKQISWAAAGGLAGWVAVRLAGADRFRCLEAPAAPLISFTPQAAVAALLGSVLLRRKGPAATAALAGAALEHRLLLRPESELEGVRAGEVLDRILHDVPVPR